ncbi:phosphomannomutase [Psychrobacter frigidicola]|uniref:phosphomannomutase n=1 Tax=Psychrobacter frigidicola TaxID=45611 RepID=A0A5C7A6I5_9GAMM|nr:phosphomannomutase [Psychrobacter frigidicola]TXD97436.1 phosphomannomutase [Psychrobacter frigidicola]
MINRSNFAAQHSLFRAYDIRGAREYFTSEFIQALGETFAQLYKSQKFKVQDKDIALDAEQIPNYDIRTVVIGYDVRCDSDIIAQTLANILHQHGLQVIRLGLITTPMMAFWAEHYDGHGIMVTASHSAKDTLGIKWMVGNASPSSADIARVYQSLVNNDVVTALNNKNNITQHSSQQLFHTPNSSLIKSPIFLPTNNVATAYINAIAHVFTRITRPNDELETDNRATLSKLNLTVVIDCMNGATSNIAQPLFMRFCKQVIMLNDTPDGNFPTGNPDPTEPNRLAELQQTVIINEADIGLAFDGDGDRLMIVDNRGKVVLPDHLLYLLATVAMTERPESTDNLNAPKILFDVKCSHHLPRLLVELGATPIMSKTGSSLMRRQLQSSATDIIFAGELSGHFIFNDSYFIIYDDAMYAGLRLLHWLAHTATVSNINGYIEFDAVSDNKPKYKTTFLPKDVWGQPKPVTSPYQLTDITQNLPILISTADQYLPLPDNGNANCAIVEHLAEFCRYLQHLVDESTSLKVPVTKRSNRAVSALTISSCTCFSTGQYITREQALRLLPVGTQLSCIDGVRLDFTRGFGILRKSNTSNSLTVRFAGDSAADLKEVQAHFVALSYSFDKNLAEQIAAITHD